MDPRRGSRRRRRSNGLRLYRGGNEKTVGEPLVLGERRHHLIRAKKNRSRFLILLHQRGSTPRELLWPELLDALEAEGANAPAVLLVDGGDHSYFHDREDFALGTHVLEEAIPAARERLDTDPRREAIGGFSMGGFGALNLARTRRFCAVGGHSPALWRSGGETPAGAFDDAEDFEWNDVIEAARPGAYRNADVWLDAGDRDPFLDATRELGRRLRAKVRVWPGEHGTRYWRGHVDEYVRFSADELARC